MRAFHFILLFMFLCKRAKGQNGRSLAFVIDRSPSMELVIDQLRTESIKLAEKIMGEESDIDNLALVVFDDPHVKPIIVNTTDINKFNEHLRGLRTYLDPTNKDCPEKALEALELALQQSNPRSYVFVFTDSSTKDVDLRYKIKELYLSKKSKVFFVLYGKCLDETDEQRTIYSDIAEESSGMVFRINYNETSQIVKGLTFLKNKILPELTVNGVDINKEYDIPVKADRRGYTIIGSGSDLELNVTCSNDCDVKYERINITSRATVHNPQTNIHVSAKGNGDVFVSAYSFKILNYTHGFSIQKPRKMENTEPEPDQYKLNYLAIKLKDSTKVSQIGEAVIMNVTDELYFNLSLEKISDNLYVTEATGFPKTAFKILVKGVDSDTGEKIQGIIDIPENKNYAHTKAFATETETVFLPCKFSSANKTAQWSFERKYPKRESMITVPFSHTITSAGLILPNVNVWHNGRFSCNVPDSPGTTSMYSSDLEVMKNPVLIGHNQETINVNYGSSVTLSCTIEVFPQQRLIWTHSDEKNTNGNKKFTITTGKKDFKITSNLKIKSVTKSETYVCRPKRNQYKIEKIINVVVHGEKPMFEVPSLIKKTHEGNDVQLPCSTIEGKPKPSIRWRRKHKTSNAMEVIETVNSRGTLTLNNVQLSDAGHYICTAENEYGHNEQDTEVIVQAAPKIDKKASVRSGIVGDNNMSLPCSVTGYPAPDVIWRANDTLKLQPDNKYDIRPDNTLIIKHVEHTDAFTSYTCVANNAFGNDTRTFKDVINEIPKFESTTVVTKVMAGENVDIHCSPIEGKPKPKISWRKIDRSTNKSTNLSTSNQGTLTHNNVQLSDAGHYICSAENEYGHDEQDTELIVQVELDLGTVHSKHALENSKLQLDCPTPSTKKYTVRWFKNGNVTNFHDKSLLLKDLKRNSTDKYTCRVSTDLGSTSTTFDLEVGAEPKFQVLKRVDHDGSIKVNWNTQTRLDCDATTHPSINTIEWYHNGHLIVNVTTNETDAMQQDVMEWGQYTCIIKNRHGHLSRTFNVSSDDCFIRENFRSAESNEPLLLTDNKKRPILTKSNRDDKYFLEIPHKTSLKLICPNYDQIKNSFTHIPTKNTLDATCEFEDHFLVNDQLLKFSDIKCSNHVLPQVKETKEPCHENSFNFKIVYLDTNVNLFDVCYDTKNERPVYASAILDHSEKTDAIVSCFGCYSNGSLVRNNDVIGSSVVRENGLKNVNNVLIWNPPKGPHGDSTRRNFHQLESAFHVVALSFEYGLEAWTGVYQYISIDDKVVPKYLWKILRVIEDNAYYVFIYVNHPNESDEDIWCDNEDGLDTDTFQHALDKYTYMCEINQFLEKTKFNITIFKAA